MVDNERATSQAQGLTFEQSFAKLEQIVHQLEEGQLGLSESLARYEEAVGYLKLCHETLREAERRIALLTGVDAEGNPVTEPFDDDALTLEEKQESRGRRRSRSPVDDSSRPADKSAGKGDADVDNQRGLF